MTVHQALSTVAFFKNLSTETLSLLQSKNLNLDIEKLTSDEAQIYWEESVTEDKRNECRLDCCEIALLSNENGQTFILQAIRYSTRLSEIEKISIEQSIDKFESYQDKATWIYVKHKDLLDRAGKFCFIDEIRDTAWKRRKGFDSRTPSTDTESLRAFSDSLSQYFYKTKKKGRHCLTEFIKRGDTYLFFAHQEDAAVRENQFDADRMAPVTRKPEYLVVFAFNPQKGLLEIWGEKLGRSIQTLYKIFAENLLNLEKLPPEQADSNYNLQKVLTERLKLIPKGSTTLQSLKLIEIQLVNKDDSRRYVSIKSSQNEEALYDEFDERLPAEVRGQYLVDTLRFKAVFESPKINGRTRRFSLKSPNECTLGLDNDSEEIKKVLIDSGLEYSK